MISRFQIIHVYPYDFILQCQAPIQKNDGCNHMTCRGCRYEFCWICSGDWKQHNTETGGEFFRYQKGHPRIQDFELTSRFL